MGANIIQLLEIISLNGLACIEHTETSTFTPLSNVWGIHVDLGLLFESAD